MRYSLSRRVGVALAIAGLTVGVVTAQTGTTQPPPAAVQPVEQQQPTFLVPAADFSFSHTERLRMELPAGPDMKGVSAWLLDRRAQPLQVSVAVGQRMDEGAGQLWITADVTLAPLAAGDYAIELTTSSGPETRLSITGFRVGR